MPDTNNELRIEGRKRALELEKVLAEHHRSLAGLLGELDENPLHDASDRLQAALWHLGAAIIQIARAQQD